MFSNMTVEITIEVFFQKILSHEFQIQIIKVYIKKDNFSNIYS